MLKSGLVLLATCATLGTAAPALAQQVTGSSGTALTVDLETRLLGVATNSLEIGPIARSAGQGPGNYADSASTASATGALTLFNAGLARTDLSLETGLLFSNASGTAAGSTASAGVVDFGLALDAITRGLFGTRTVTLFELGTGALSSTASVDAVTGAFIGSSTIAGLTAGGSVGGLALDFGALAAAGPNAVLLNALGLRVTFNEQITAGNLFTTNALSLRFNNFAAGTNLVSGSIILGQSQVARLGPVTPPAVPEPATWAMMIAGFGMVGAAMRSRRHTVVTA